MRHPIFCDEKCGIMIEIKSIDVHLEGEGKPSLKGHGYLQKSGNTEVMFVDVSADSPLDSETAVSIDFDLPGLARFMGDWRRYEFWCSTCFGEKLSEVENNTQGFIAELDDGSFTVVLPLVSDDYKAVLIGTEDNLLRCQVFSWYKGLKTCKCPAFVTASGYDPYALLEDCAREAVKVLNKDLKLINERKYPEILEYLGWCSWDAFEIRVDEPSIKAKCEEFKAKGIPVRWMILDDMWGEVHDFYGAAYKTREEMFDLMHRSKLYSFKADPKRFPDGLKALVGTVNGYGIKMGVWHPITGYWKGIDKSGELYQEYKDALIDTYEEVCIPSFETDKAYRFFRGFHDYLKSCGVEFVKVDNQSINRRYYKGLAPVGKTAALYHKALERSVNEHFGGNMINCMGMASEDMWNRSDSPVSRCSDDFKPEDRAWFVKHITQCTYNALIQGLFYHEDFDMWWTDDGQAFKNSLLRAVSGGPIYVSDTLGRSNAGILAPLCLEDGRILRCDRPGVPTRDCLCVDPTKSGRAFKVRNTANGCGIMAVFNLSADNKPVTAVISPSDIEGLIGEEFGVYDNLNRKLTVLKRDEAISLTLEDNDSLALFNIIPLKGGNGIIGLVDKFIAPKTYSLDENGEPQFAEKGEYAYIKDRKLFFMKNE